MAKRKIFYYTLNLFETVGNISVDFTELKNKIIEIIENNSADLGAYRTLDLTIDPNSLMHIMMDVLSYKGDVLFCRLSKQKNNNSVLKRNYKTRKCSDVLTPTERADNGIESYTYGMINYKLGIYAYVKAQSAPDETIISNIFTKFENKYFIKMLPIPNQIGIDAIYYGNNPEVSKIEVELPVPEADILEKIFKWNEKAVTDAIVQNGCKVSIIISTTARGRLVEDSDAKSLIQGFKDTLSQYWKVKLTAKADGVKSKEYDLYDKYFRYDTNIKKEYMREGVNIEYTTAELADIYRQKLLESFYDNRMILENLTGRKREE